MNIPPLTTAARKTLIGANAQTGRLPQGTDGRVVEELQSYGLVAAVGMTLRGRMVRQALMDEELNF